MVDDSVSGGALISCSSHSDVQVHYGDPSGLTKWADLVLVSITIGNTAHTIWLTLTEAEELGAALINMKDKTILQSRYPV